VAAKLSVSQGRVCSLELVGFELGESVQTACSQAEKCVVKATVVLSSYLDYILRPDGLWRP
jgi:hypothetical protein